MGGGGADWFKCYYANLNMNINIQVTNQKGSIGQRNHSKKLWQRSTRIQNLDIWDVTWELSVSGRPALVIWDSTKKGQEHAC